jgi:hypothetical protein
MVEKIEVYIRSAEVPVQAVFVRGPVDHPCLDENVVKTERVISEADRRALEVVNEFAREKGLKVEICNVETFGGKLKAGVKRISKTPVVIVGQSRIEGEHSSAQLKSKLTQCFTE